MLIFRYAKYSRRENENYLLLYIHKVNIRDIV